MTVTTYGDAPNRAAAMLVDLVVLTIVIFVLAALLALVTGPVVRLQPDAETLAAAVQVDRGAAAVHAALSIVAGALYFVGSWVRWGATPGMRLLGLRVAAADAGGRLGARAALARWAIVVLPFGVAGGARTVVDSGAVLAIVTNIVVAWYAILLVTLARSPTKQGVHDRVAGSIVTKTATIVDDVPTDAR